MKIKKITLHPFAGIINKSFEFEDGLNVVFGDNEAGKSTLIKALIMVLFETTKQTPAKEKILLENLLPASGGDTVAVGLEFEYQQQIYLLKKQWGKTKQSSLNKKNEAPITDAEEVQYRMDKMLVQNKLVWENIMFTGQAKLSLTHNIIQEDNQVSKSLDSLLQNTIINNAGMAPEDIQRQIDKQLIKLKDNWDLEKNIPQVVNGRGSYDNPHKKSKGEILELDYLIHELEQKCAARKNHDIEYDKVIADIESLTQKYYQEVKTFLDAHRDNIKEYRGSVNILNEKKIAEGKYIEIEKNYNDWKTAISQIKLLQNNFENDAKSKKEIQEELSNADLKNNGENLLKNYEKIKLLDEEIKDLQEKQNKYLHIKDEDKDPIKDAHEQLKQQSAKFEALKKLQSFNVEVISINNITVDVSNGNAPKVPVELFTATPYLFKAEGGFELKSHELQIKVIADAEELKACEQELEKIKQIQNNILLKYGIDSMAALYDSHKTWAEYSTQINHRNLQISTLLGNETLEGMKTKAEKLKQMPATRSVEILRGLFQEAVNKESVSRAKYLETQNLIDGFISNYQSIEILDDIKFEKKNQIRKLTDQLNALSGILDPSVDLNELIINYDTKSGEEILFKDQLMILELTKKEIENQSDDISSADYEDQINIYTAEKNQKIAEAMAIIKVKEKLDEITNRAPANPYDGYHNNMRHYLSLLSGGKYADFSIDKSLPHSIKQQNNAPLKLSMLSQGTSGLLGMALRLSMADYFLENREGFLIMDDPMTDMDSGRQANTVNCLNDYAQTRQVIVFTCHESHAEQFGGNKINLN